MSQGLPSDRTDNSVIDQKNLSGVDGLLGGDEEWGGEFRLVSMFTQPSRRPVVLKKEKTEKC
jgi:hypothetical protein